jgi:hypothetical protein
MNFHEAQAQWSDDASLLASKGVILPEVKSYKPDEFGSDFGFAMDAQPSLVTTSNAGIPAFLTTVIDPSVIRVLLAPNKAATIFGEVKKGDWLLETAMFPVVERTGEVSTYGDFNENGHSGINTNWPQRQSYLFQVIKEYGEREMERAGLARINWASEIDESAAVQLMKYANYTYFFGVANLQNYGLTNDPNLSAALTPATKTYGGVKWINNGVVVATANEVYNDVVSIFLQLVNQSAGLLDQESQMTLAMSPSSAVALTATNSFNVNVADLLKKNFPNLKVETAMQYGATSSSNPQGITAGNLVQLIAANVEGQETGYCAFNEKMRAHPVIRAMSSFKQKVTSGTWGAIIRQPFAIAAMVGV